ncbi:MAG: hypothetical protein ABSF14_24880 [Terriglobia bacterium]
MSEISSRPRIQHVVYEPDSLEPDTYQVIALPARAVRSLTPAAQKVLEHHRSLNRRAQLTLDRIESLPSLATRQLLLEQRAIRALSQKEVYAQDVVKLSTMVSLASTPFRTLTQNLGPLFESLATAPTISAAREARSVLLKTVTTEHHRVLEKALVLACSKASIKAGFGELEVLRGPLGSLHVVATNVDGKSLVSEIRAGDAAEDPSIATEVVGVSDGSCVDLLNEFDKALEEEGVRSIPPERRHTGGVCQLAATCEFLRRKVLPSVKAPRQGGPSLLSDRAQNAGRRAQRLSQRQTLKQR